LFADWSSKLARFADYLVVLPSQVAPGGPPDALIFARRALDAAIDRLDPDLPLAERLELKRIADGFVHGDAIAEAYALETRLVRRGDRRRPMLTELGRVFSRLRGKDAESTGGLAIFEATGL
jgi:hypothetical protein